MQTKKKHSKRFTRTKRSSSTRNKLKRNQTGGARSEIYVETAAGNWQPAHWYQKEAFNNFVTQYTRGGLNMNPDNVYQYDNAGFKFNVLGEIYIVRKDDSRMRIKSVQLPEGTPDPDFDNTKKPDGTDNKYYFEAANGNNYFNNSINQEIETNKRSSKDFRVGNSRYRVVLDAQVTPDPNKAVVKIGILQGAGNSYPLYYEFTPGWLLSAHSGV
jgi:hypothetical protein